MHIGQTLPVLTVQTQRGHIDLPDATGGNWAYFLFHPAAFTPVCSTEIARIAEMRNAPGPRLGFFSVVPDPVTRVRTWLDSVATGFGVTIDHPCISDADGALTRAFFGDACQTGGPGPRGCFLFDPARRLAAKTILPAEVGFSSQELLRVVSALCLTRHGEALAPVDWRPGQPLIETR